MDYRQFQQVFPAESHLPYDRKAQQDIEAHRKKLDGVLFIDRVLRALGISKGKWQENERCNGIESNRSSTAKLYPPKTENALKQLHQTVCEASMSTHHKLSLLYYILLDFDAASSPPSVAEAFAVASGIPQSYKFFMDGLWYLDRLNFSVRKYPLCLGVALLTICPQAAVEYLAQPSLGPDFSDDIITALVRHAPEGDYSLPLAYFTTVRPVIKTSSALELLFDAMAKTNVTEAMLYSRTFPENSRELLFRRMVGAVLQTDKGDSLTSQSSELVFLPLDATEDSWLEEYLTTGEGRTLKKAKDMLLVRRIACDKFDELGRYKASGQWAAVLEGIKSGIEGRTE